MNFAELKNTLGLVNGIFKNATLTIATNTLTENVNDLLLYCYDNQPIVLDQATLFSENAATNTLTIQGKSNFLNVAGLSVLAQFTIDDKSQVQLVLRYSLIGSTPGPNDWKFSRSFPFLPQVGDYNQPAIFDRLNRTVTQPTVAPLDTLFLYDACFIVVSALTPQQDPDFKIDLRWGINFVSHLKTQGFVAVVENLFQYKNQLTLYGTIRKPLPTETANSLPMKYAGSPEQYLYPWGIVDDFAMGVPGILLQVDLELSYTLADNKIDFRGDKLYIYTPLTNDWVLPDTNPRFIPTQAYTGRIKFTDTPIEVDMVCVTEIGVDEFTLTGFFKGVSLANLAQLTGLVGSGESPLSHLPDQIKSAGQVLGKLELMSVSITIDYSDLTAIALTYTSFAIGMPELKWQVWDDHFEIDSIACMFEISNPLGTGTDPDDYNYRQMEVTVYGEFKIEGVPFDIYASNQDGFTVYAELAEAQTLSLKKILETYAPQVPAPSDLTINIFRIGIAPQSAYTMALAMAQQPNTWIIPIGPGNGLTVQDVSMSLMYPKGGPLTGSVSGTIKLGSIATLSAIYDIPGNIAIRSLIPEIYLKSLLDALTNQAFEIPDAFDLHLTNNSMLMQKQGESYLFQLATQVEGFGSLALQIQKVDGSSWGGAFGLDMSSGMPSGLPGLGFLSNFESMFSLSKFMLVISSFDGPGFQFPDTANFNNQNINAKRISLPAQASNALVAGLNVYAQWHIDSSDKKQKLLKELLGLNAVLGMTLQVGKNPEQFSKLFISYNTTIQGHPLACKVGAQIMDGSIGLFMNGSLTVDIQGQPQTFDVILQFAENGAFVSATMKGNTSVNFSVFKLSNLALEIGINWEGIPSLGVAATIDIEKFESSIAVFFDSAEPQKSLVAGAVSDLSLKDVVDTFTSGAAPSLDALDKVAIKGTHTFQIAGSVADALDNLKMDSISAACQAHGLTLPASQSQVLLVVNTRGQLWYITDMVTMRHYTFRKTGETITVSTEAQFYCAPQNTYIGSILFHQGFYINGAITFFGFEASMTLDISTSRGIAVDATMDPIVIGNGVLFSIKAEQGDGGPVVSVSTFQQTAAEQPKPEFQPPHFYINGQLETLGLKKGIFVSVTKDGLKFDLNGDLVPGIRFDLKGHFDSFTNLDLGGEVNIVIGEIDLGPLGKINIGTGVDGNLDIGVKGTNLFAKLGASFEFAGSSHSLGTLDLDISESTLTNLGAFIEQKVKDFLQDLLTDPDKWAGYVANGFISGVEDVEDVLDNVFHSPSGATNKCALTSAMGSML